MARVHHPPATKREAIRLHLAGESARAIGQRLGVDHKTVLAWVDAAKLGAFKAREGGAASVVQPKPAKATAAPAKRVVLGIGDEDEPIEFDQERLLLEDMRIRLETRDLLLRDLRAEDDDGKVRAILAKELQATLDGIRKAQPAPAKSDDDDDDGSDESFGSRFFALAEKMQELGLVGGSSDASGAVTSVPVGSEVDSESLPDGADGSRLAKTGS